MPWVTQLSRLGVWTGTHPPLFMCYTERAWPRLWEAGQGLESSPDGRCYLSLGRLPAGGSRILGGGSSSLSLSRVE